LLFFERRFLQISVFPNFPRKASSIIQVLTKRGRFETVRLIKSGDFVTEKEIFAEGSSGISGISRPATGPSRWFRLRGISALVFYSGQLASCLVRLVPALDALALAAG